MRITRSIRRALLPVLALLAAGCQDAAGPQLGGEYLGAVDSPYGAEGAVLVELVSPDIREVWAPGRIMIARAVSERTLRILVMNPPRNLQGGPITFRVRMATGAVPPRAEVIQATSPVNYLRDFTGGYAVRFNQVAEEGAVPVTPPTSGGPTPPIAFDRLVAPFFPGGLGLHPQERTLMDQAGNSNRLYDIGDLRGYLMVYPSAIPAPTVWSR